MSNLTGKTLSELRAMTPSEICTARVAYLAPLSKKELIELEMDATEFTDKPEVTTGEHGILARTQTMRDAEGDVLQVETIEHTYFPTGEINEIIRVVRNASGDEIDDGRIEHSLTAQPVGHSVLTVVLAPADVSGITAPMHGKCWKLIDVGNYSLWAVDAPASVLMALHEELWAMSPTEVLGVLAVASARSNVFLPAAVRHYTEVSVEDALARRDKIADYLDGLGKNTTVLCTATTEHDVVNGIVVALGYTLQNVWDAM